MKSLFKLLYSVVMCLLIGVVCMPYVGPNVFWICGAMLVYAFLPVKMDVQGSLQAPVVHTELFTGELISKFRFVGKWLGLIKDENGYVNNNVIHMADVGADPDILIDNSVYPIATNTRDDQDIAVALRKIETTNTKVKDDDLYALSYDKIASVVDQHKETIEEGAAKLGLHSLCPSVNSADTPVIETTGPTDGNGRKRLITADVATLKLKCDNLGIPMDNQSRLLILCNDHVNDLLLTDQSFKDRFINTKTGEPMDFFGFTTFQDVYAPTFNAAGTKKAYGATAAAGDRKASTLVIRQRAFKARGSITMYYKIATTDPENRESKVGFKLYHVVLPKKNTGFGAILNAPSA